MSRIRTAVILAAGMGSRLYGVTEDKVPKGLMKVNGKSLVERSIEKLKSIGIEKIFIVTGHLSEQYDELSKKDKCIETKKNRCYKATGSMTSLAILENKVKEDFILLESDLIYEVNALIETILFKKKDCILLSGRTNSGDECYVEIKNKNLYKISKNKEQIHEVYGELVGISKISIRLYKNMIKRYKALVSEDNETQELEDIEKKSMKKHDYENIIFDIAKNNEVGYLKIDDLTWGEIDDRSHLERVKKYILPKLNETIVKAD